MEFEYQLEGERKLSLASTSGILNPLVLELESSGAVQVVLVGAQAPNLKRSSEKEAADRSLFRGCQI